MKTRPLFSRLTEKSHPGFIAFVRGLRDAILIGLVITGACFSDHIIDSTRALATNLRASVIATVAGSNNLVSNTEPKTEASIVP